MEQALLVIIGFSVPLSIMCIIGTVYGLYTNKRDRSVHKAAV